MRAAALLFAMLALAAPAAAETAPGSAATVCLGVAPSETKELLAACALAIGDASDSDDVLAAVRVRRGDALRALGDFDAAMADYDAALALRTREDRGAHLGRGAILLARGDVAAALADFDGAVRGFTINAAALGYRCIARWRLGEGEAALHDCAGGQDYLKPYGFPDNWPWVAEAGVRLLGGNLPAAEVALAEALRRNPKTAQALALRALVMARKGDKAGAARQMAAARALQANVETALAHAFGPDLAAGK